MKPPMKRAIKRLFSIAGFEIRRRRPGGQVGPRMSLAGSLRQVRDAGFIPQTVLDIGAAQGNFTTECYRVFPDASYVMVEPLQENTSAMNRLMASIPRCRCIAAAAGRNDGDTTIHVHADLVGSSTYLEHEDSDVNGLPRSIRVIALDSHIQADGGPFLLKVDVQGAELDVLAGAEATLVTTEYVVLEVSLFQFFVGGPLFHDVVSFMKTRGFVVHDVAGLLYRPLDGALAQMDVVFVKEDGILRRHHVYATKEQRHHQDELFRRLQQPQ
jgi:FkbM family methyltransferase